MLGLTDKRFLFFSPRAFGYEDSIRKRIEESGATVVYYDDRPSNSFWGKALLRARPHLMQRRINKYYKSICGSLFSAGNFDYIFLLNLEAMPLWFLAQLKKWNPNAYVVFYMWDSLNNKPNAVQYIKYCDKVFSFDPQDEGNHGFTFRPLFYINEYKEIANNNDYEYDLCFIGTAHSDRLRIARAIDAIFLSMGGKVYNYLYLQSKKLWLYLKLRDSYFENTHCSDFKYVSLSTEETLRVVSKSKIVLDIQHPKQTGLTMRTIEMIGARRKLITTNPAIINYDFYNPNNICLINRDGPIIIDKEFLNSPYESINPELYYKYSIDGWLEELFSKNV